MGLLDSDYNAVMSGMVKRSGLLYPPEDIAANAKNNASLLADFLPVIGGAKGTYEELKAGNPGMAALNAATIPLDLIPGAGTAAKLGLVGMFAGKGAKTFDALKAAKAEKMIVDGVDRAKVWQETGYGHAPWQKPGTDAAVRHELDDSKAVFEKPFRQPTSQEVSKAIEAQDFIRSIDAAKKEARNQHGYTLKGFYDARPGDYEKYQKAQETFRAYNRDFVDPKVKQGYLADFLDHNEAYAAYPKTSIIPTTYNQAHSGGSYMPEMNQMLIGLGDEKSVTLHELQHAIQQREGWARGGSNVPSREMEQSLNSDLQNLLMQNPKAESVYNDWSKIYNDIEAGREFDPVKYESLEEQLSSLKGGGEIMDRHHSLSGLADSSSAQSVANDYYKRLAGEAEARLTQYRMNLSPEERLAQYPYDPEYFKKATGVDIDKLIVRGLLGE